MRTIDADAIKARLRGCMILMPNGMKCTAERAIDTQGTIEAEPVRHGRWIERWDDWSILGESNYQCSKCDCEMKYRTNYCPRCGAKMDGGAEK